MSAITEDPSASREEERDPYFEPVLKLTTQVVVKTNEEDEDELHKFRSKLFRFVHLEGGSPEWKERGTGDVRLLKHKESKKIRLVMRRDKTLKVCANHLVTSDMKLQPNVGSDRSWVWKVAADYSEDPPTSETLAIRFANSEIANQFKEAFEAAQESNKELPSNSEPAPPKESEPASPKELGPTPTEGKEEEEPVTNEVVTNEEAKEEAKE